LWNLVSFTTTWEQSLFDLTAFEDNVLSFWIVYTYPSTALSGSFKRTWFAFVGALMPIVSIVTNGKRIPVSSPLIKRNKENTVILLLNTGLFSPFGSPEGRMITPVSVIFFRSPRISHLNKFVFNFTA
jgi:hypothetical protein